MGGVPPNECGAESHGAQGALEGPLKSHAAESQRPKTEQNQIFPFSPKVPKRGGVAPNISLFTQSPKMWWGFTEKDEKVRLCGGVSPKVRTCGVALKCGGVLPFH